LKLNYKLWHWWQIKLLRKACDQRLKNNFVQNSMKIKVQILSVGFFKLFLCVIFFPLNGLGHEINFNSFTKWTDTGLDTLGTPQV